jgi:hypothetical protein
MFQSCVFPGRIPSGLSNDEIEAVRIPMKWKRHLGKISRCLFFEGVLRKMIPSLYGDIV